MARKTIQRNAIKKVLEQSSRPLNPREILHQAKKIAPTLGVATVYRTLKSLVGHKRVNVVELPGESSRYELASRKRHYHFQCRECGRVFPVNGQQNDFQRLLPPGFTLNGYQVILYGRCPECNNAV